MPSGSDRCCPNYRAEMAEACLNRGLRLVIKADLCPGFERSSHYRKGGCLPSFPKSRDWQRWFRILPSPSVGPFRHRFGQLHGSAGDRCGAGSKIIPANRPSLAVRALRNSWPALPYRQARDARRRCSRHTLLHCEMAPRSRSTASTMVSNAGTVSLLTLSRHSMVHI